MNTSDSYFPEVVARIAATMGEGSYIGPAPDNVRTLAAEMASTFLHASISCVHLGEAYPDNPIPVFLTTFDRVGRCYECLRDLLTRLSTADHPWLDRCDTCASRVDESRLNVLARRQVIVYVWTCRPCTPDTPSPFDN